MNKAQVKLTVLFDGTFWIGFFEKKSNNKLQVAKVTFGKEPKDIELNDYIINKYQYLKFSNPTIIDKEKNIKTNPKRMKRNVRKQVKSFIGTKSQQVLKKQQEENKIERKLNTIIKKEELEKMKFALKQKKKLLKHKGK